MEQVFALERTSLRGVSCGFFIFISSMSSNLKSTRWIIVVSLRFSVPLISVWVSPVYAEYISTAIVTHRYFRFLRRKCIYAYCFLIVNRFVVFFLCSLIYCVISVWVSAVYAKYVSTPIHPSNVHKKSVLKETRIPVVHVNNLRLVWFLRFSVAWFIV